MKENRKEFILEYGCNFLTSMAIFTNDIADTEMPFYINNSLRLIISEEHPSAFINLGKYYLLNDKNTPSYKFIVDNSIRDTENGYKVIYNPSSLDEVFNVYHSDSIISPLYTQFSIEGKNKIVTKYFINEVTKESKYTIFQMECDQIIGSIDIDCDATTLLNLSKSLISLLGATIKIPEN